MSCIYALTEPDDLSAIRYIGKTKLPVEVRYRQHLQDNKAGYKTSWIRSLPEGKLPSICVIDECPEHLLNTREVYWISYYKSLGYRLTNMTCGGDGGYIALTEDAKKKKSIKISTALKGKKHSEEHIQNRAKSLIGKPHTEEHRRKIGDSVRGDKNGFYGKSHSDESKELIRQRNKEYAERIKSEQGSRFTPEQMAKMSARFRKSGKYYGVSRSGNRWRCRLYKDGKEVRFGTFDTQEEAAHAWDRNVRNFFPDAPLNFH